MLTLLSNTEQSETGPMANVAPPARVVLAKVGLDGHDRGVKIVARGLRDAGFHVIYAGLWQSPAAVARAVADEDADWLGLSLLSGAHMTLVPRVQDALRQAGVGDAGLLVGGIIPDEDVPRLIQLGVARVFGPGTRLDEIGEFLRRREHAPVNPFWNTSLNMIGTRLAVCCRWRHAGKISRRLLKHSGTLDRRAGGRGSLPLPAAAAWARAR